MTVTRALLSAKHIGVRELREHLSKRLKERKPIIITDHGAPVKVIFSYGDVLDILDILDELQDRSALENVREGRLAVKRGARGIPVARLFHQIRRLRSK